MSEVLLPPWIAPQAESSTLIDDSTSVFRAAYAPGNAQRVGYSDPRLQVKQSFKGLRGTERAAMLAFLSRAKGKLNTVRALCGYAFRGSFPASEMFTNNDFSNGTTGWAANSQFSISAIDHGIRATRIQNAGGGNVSQSVTLVAAIPYSARGFVNAGAGNVQAQIADSSGALGNIASQGMLQAAFTRVSGSDSITFFDSSSAGQIAGNFFDVKWASFSRCGQVDNGQNLIKNSDTPGTGTGWSLNGATAASASSSGPDGQTDAWGLTETAVNAQHNALQTIAVDVAPLDYTESIFVKAGTRSWCYIEISNGVTAIFQWFNLSTGALGTSSVGAGFSLISAQCLDYGLGWKRCILTVRKTDSSTSILPVIAAATGDAVQTYLGSASSPAILTWRASFAQSSVPVSAAATISTALPQGTGQTGNALYLKGLPVSTAGLLLEGDPFEINGELKTALSALNSDAAGLGYITFGPSLCRVPADADGVVIYRPMGKFILATDASWVNDFGVYADVDITLEAINE